MKTKLINELRQKYELNDLLKILEISRTTYFYNKKHMNDKISKDEKLVTKIHEIYNKNYHKYGYLRITIELKNNGININKKKVQRIMQQEKLYGKTKKRHYHSYKGVVGKIAKNILDRDFSTTRPYEKLGTDVSEFNIKNTKVYFSPIVDFHTREILAYNISYHPNFKQIEDMMKDLKDKHGNNLNGSILHSDQGWQYQMLKYRMLLKDLNITQSMSRKGNCYDNSPTENLFGIIKNEMFYDAEFSYESAESFINDLDKYIKYYNEKRIVSRLRSNPKQIRSDFMVDS